MRNDRSIERSLTGTSSTWSTNWAGDPDEDTSWTGLSSDGDYLYALRVDGRIDRATIGSSPSWSASHGDVGSGISFDKIDNPIPEFMTLMVPILCSLALLIRKRKGKK